MCAKPDLQIALMRIQIATKYVAMTETLTLANAYSGYIDTRVLNTLEWSMSANAVVGKEYLRISAVTWNMSRALLTRKHDRCYASRLENIL